MLLMQDGILIVYVKRDWNLFILDSVAFRKSMQVNIQIMMTTRQNKPMHLISYIKKVRIWQRRFEHASNVKVIWALKLLTRMENLGKNYDPAEIYSDSKAFKPEKSLDNPNPTNNNFANTNIVIEMQHKTIMKMSRITNSDFDKICEYCVKSKQT